MTCVLLGPPTHGVRSLAAELAATLDAPTTALDTLADAPCPPGPTHLHVTPALCGATPEEAARALVEWIGERRDVTLTLHDLPQASDGAAMAPRRAACVRAWCEAAAGVVVSSDHEAALLAACGVTTVPAVIPLPVEPLPPGEAPWREETVGVLGFVYPGKGHAEAIDAAARAGLREVVAVGAVSAGHDDLARELAARAAERGVGWRLTGFVDEAGFARWARSVAVPVAAHRHVSASGSINSWLAAGRRPLVLPGRYVDEMATRRPGTLTVVEEATAGSLADALADAMARAAAEPSTTWLGPDAVTAPDRAGVAAALRAWWAR